MTFGPVRRRSHKGRMQRKKLRSQNEQMKALMSGLMARKGEGGPQAMDQLVHAHELVFVMTDMEGSTSQASANPAAFEKVQQVHDMVRHHFPLSICSSPAVHDLLASPFPSARRRRMPRAKSTEYILCGASQRW